MAVTLPYTFANGTATDATQMNADLNALVVGVNAALPLAGGTLTGNLMITAASPTVTLHNTSDGSYLGVSNSGGRVGLAMCNSSGAETAMLVSSDSAGNMTAAGSITSTGGNASVGFVDRTSSRTWLWYGTSDIARLWNGSGDTIWVSPGGNLTSAGTISAGANLQVNGAATVNGASTFNGNLTTAGSSTLTTNGPAVCNYTLVVNNRCTVADFQSNANVYVPSGFVYGGTQVHSGNTLQVDGAATVNGSCTVGDFRSNANVFAPSGYGNFSQGVYMGSGGPQWRNNGGYMWSDNTVRTFGILPTADNNSSSGLSGTAWAQVASYWFNNVSDASLKTAVARPAAGALDQVMRLAPVEFHWQQSETPDMPRHRGFLAGDVLEVMGGSFAGYHKDPESGIEGLAYHELVAVLWQAVQELSRQVAELKGAAP